ncbi:dickkopf-related protein 3a isoform X2 [Takifugu rubripes]|uniref:dickkopf-related protein 3a isoform X2 n=1 Tax=Takifugu rubripes TaxID=31033 RepID=UPI0011453858|nr:dickkopf-related protein 3 isoform X2 [Takifugu rubripes]
MFEDVQRDHSLSYLPVVVGRKSPQYRYHSNGCRQMNNVLDWPPGRRSCGVTLMGRHLPSAAEAAPEFCVTPAPLGVCSRRTNSCGIMRVALLVLALTAVCNGILPEIVHPGVTHILGDYYGQTGQPELDDESVEVEQRSEDLQPAPEDAVRPNNNLGPPPSGLQNETDQEPVSVEQEKGSISTDDPSSDLENSIEQGCVSAEDCGRGKYCLQNTQRSRCRPCKPVDVPCTLDEECCDGQLCVWGQCSHNATRGEAGSTCRRQSDCGPDLCCAVHAVLLFPVCSAKPIERERCFGAPNHVMELLSWDAGDEGPRKHCPCVGDLQCQHLGRGSMCLKEEDSSEEDLADSLYSEIDYII